MDNVNSVVREWSAPVFKAEVQLSYQCEGLGKDGKEGSKHPRDMKWGQQGLVHLQHLGTGPLQGRDRDQGQTLRALDGRTARCLEQEESHPGAQSGRNPKSRRSQMMKIPNYYPAGSILMQYKFWGYLRMIWVQQRTMKVKNFRTVNLLTEKCVVWGLHLIA